ncbi:MAG: hypothetical protein P1V97_18295 [Planctomycetota bacterium]|nr:hypothetical protein [Planctomycetota bacterium]
MKSLQTKQCECGSKAFLGRRCALCHERLPDSFFELSPGQALLKRFKKSYVLHLIPSWLIYAGLLFVSDAVWIPNEKHTTPAMFGGFILGLLSVGYLGAPLAAYFRGRWMRVPSQSEQQVAVVLVRCSSMIFVLIMTGIMLTGRIPLIMR